MIRSGVRASTTRWVITSTTRWVITTGKGDVYVTLAHSAAAAVTLFNKRWPGLEVASIVEATEF